MAERVELTIQEVAERTGLSVHTLRYYERAGLLPGVARHSGGHRRYSEMDVSGVDFIQKLRNTGMPIRSVRRYIELIRQGDSTADLRKSMLEAHRTEVLAQVAELNRCLTVIDAKIAFYETGVWPEGPVPCPPHLKGRRLDIAGKESK